MTKFNDYKNLKALKNKFNIFVTKITINKFDFAKFNNNLADNKTTVIKIKKNTKNLSYPKGNPPY